MNKTIFTWFFILLMVAGTARLKAQTAVPFPTLEADPKAYEYARQEQASWQTLTELSLWASGADGSATGKRQPFFEGLIRGAVDELRMSPALPLYPREKGVFVLAFMHKKFLKTYAPYQVKLDTLLTSGTYNCVSSAVLYMILAVSVGLDVKGVMTRDHAFVMVNAGGSLILDVETANPLGFDPGTRREFHDNFHAVTGFTYVPARNYRDRASISQLELVSLILSNRITELESRNRFNEAVPLAVNRAALLSQRRNPAASSFFSDPRKDLIDLLLNFGNSLVRAGKEEEALRWAGLAEARYPDEEWQDFIYTVVNTRLVQMLQNQRISEAQDLFNANLSRLSPGNAAAFRIMILDADLVQQSSRIRSSDNAEAVLKLLDEVKTTSILPAGRIEELRTFVLLKAAELLALEKSSLEALKFIEAAITRYGKNSQLENSLQVFRTNRVAELHNTFVDLFNHRNYEGARQFILDALKEFPGNRHLSADLELVEKAIKKK
ncbi:MAG: hypothetical protein LBT13_03890 [Treponema sp.]|jgi:tetratricopeptide (TPR) repeat protein|nr:hypothetical protein [Treponema sp.]